MGFIKRPKKKLNMENVLVNVKNWRMLKEGNHSGHDGVFIVLNNCRMFFLQDVTIDIIHQINHQKLTRTTPFLYLRNTLCCAVCGGIGTVDWIQNVRKISCHSQLDFRDYKRNKNGEILELNGVHMASTEGYGKFIISTPIKRKDLHYCSVCYGCGLKISTNAVVKRSYKEERC